MQRHGRLFARAKSRLARTRLGQISILIVFSLIPMFTLLAFVINIGMLVNAKISLQNAADMAAYAGAASQARYLTNISHLNYYMRQIYKKFIYKYYVLGNISQKCFPRTPDLQPGVCSSFVREDPQAFFWKNVSTSGQPGAFPGVPAVCISLSKESNPCQIVSAVPVVAPPGCSASEPACSQLIGAAQAIGDIQHKSCRSTSIINHEVLVNWMYATDFDRTLQTNANLNGLIADDLGLVPEEILMLERIRNLKDIINEKPKKNINQASARALQERATDLTKNERTILAFQSAFNNLNHGADGGEGVFDADTIEMTELLEDGVDMLNLKELQVHGMQAAYVIFGGSDTTPANGDCPADLGVINADPFVGVAKETNSHVYYAVKLTARAKILFNPFPIGHAAPDIELTAYAAAMPFGSRIGPDLSGNIDDSFTVTKNGGGATFTGPVKYPRLPIDNNQHSSESADVLLAYFKTLQDEGAGGGTQVIGNGNVSTNNLVVGMHAAMLPDQFEVGKYNIPADTDSIDNNNNEFLPYFKETPAAPGTDKRYTFWAPIVPVNGNQKFHDDISNALDALIFATHGSNGNVFEANAGNLKNDLISRIGNALTKLQQDSNHEGANVFRMPDPLGTNFFATRNYPNIPGKIAGPPDAFGPKLATSFTTDHDQHYFKNGRDGYSVKLIPFKLLLSKPGKLTPNGPAWPAVRDSFGGARADLQQLAH